jgi:hypothetical protein
VKLDRFYNLSRHRLGQPRHEARRHLEYLGDLVCGALLVAAFVAFALMVVQYLPQMQAEIGVLPR